MTLIASDRHTLIVGLGQTGLSCVRHCRAQGRSVTVADSRVNPPGLETLTRVYPEVSCHTGPFDPQFFAGFSELLVSPGISLQEPAIQAAAEAGALIRGDVDLFARDVQAPVVAVTGSNGKSTVVTLLGDMAREAGVRACVAGNIGYPVLDALAEDADLYVLELSSFQLETTHDLGALAATCLNISDDHMDRYPNRQSYFEAKHRIFQGCGTAVVNLDDPLSQPLLRDGMQVEFFGFDRVNLGDISTREDEDGLWITLGLDNLINTRELSVRGTHNIANVMAALALGKVAGLPMDAMLAAARRFRGLPHRCQTVRVHHGVTWVNDSKGTNVGATVAAIESLANEHERIVLIAGGDGKGADFGPLAQPLARYARAVVTLGADGPRLAEALQEVVSVQQADTMDAAVASAAELAREGDLVLLSPACSSLDMFASYEARGDAFARAVEVLS